MNLRSPAYQASTVPLTYSPGPLLSIFLINIIYFMYASVLPGALRGQKKVLDPLELELQMFVDHPVGAET